LHEYGSCSNLVHKIFTDTTRTFTLFKCSFHQNFAEVQIILSYVVAFNVIVFVNSCNNVQMDFQIMDMLEQILPCFENETFLFRISQNIYEGKIIFAKY